MKKVVTVILISIAGIMIAILDVFIVSSPSMEPGLIPGDIIVCTKYSSIERGDLVVFEHSKHQQAGIKRVVGLPGDKIGYLDKSLSINHIPVHKRSIKTLSANNAADRLFSQRLNGKPFNIHESYFNSGQDILIENHDGYFVLGDNRDQSVDSRTFGAIRQQSIICKALFILATEQQHGITTNRTGQVL